MGEMDTVSENLETVVQETVRTMRQFRHVAVVQAQACLALYNLTAGNEHKVLLQRTEAVQAGAFEVVLAAMNTHPDQHSMLQWAMRALLNMVSGGDDITAERKQRAMSSGILKVVASTMSRCVGMTWDPVGIQIAVSRGWGDGCGPALKEVLLR